eukprot:161210_1
MMTTESDAEDYHSTAELECFMQDVHDSDVEIKLFDRDGKVLSDITEHNTHLDESSDMDHQIMDYDPFSIGHPTANGSDFYYILKDRKLRPPKNKRHKLKYLIHSINKMCDAPHLYIQQRSTTNSCLQNLMNYVLFMDQYLSFKYFYELCLPLPMELLLVFGVFLFHPICIVILILIYCILLQQIPFCMFTLIACFTSAMLLRIMSYLKVLPFRSLPNVIHNLDEYGFNIKRRLNLRSMFCNKNMDKHSSFPCYNTSNATIVCLSSYLYTRQPLLFVCIPYVIIARCYFAYNYLMDCVFSLLFAVCIVAVLCTVLPPSSLISVDEIIREMTANMLS